ncbi:uncharacterized protein GGQ92_001414 [Gracilibacillus halotolerans]|uniref:DUF418 domain-containing protein n=1 Tax=Gracilibacillus halotolerans TaxID=74386 RepID=A0A841RPP5_9BACI|nr:DUF418 domain-containing protein [Gracilibacillus halotolerans]MBB6512628.1 uncharacterized protein [Gracilibacillus halotolerans]
MQELQPLTVSKRLPWIDTARGFAILGIFLVNIATFNSPYFLYGDGQNMWGPNQSTLWQSIIDIFVQASFYSLFSFLFGFGMYIIYSNLQAKQIEKPNTILVKRLFILLGIGMIHAFLIWHGDILISYAIIGFLLLLFMKQSNTSLLVWSLCLMLIPTVMLSALLFLATALAPNESLIQQAAVEASFQNYGNGSWGDILGQNMTDWLYANNPFQLFFIICNLLPIFLLGLMFARNKWLHDIQGNKKFLMKIWLITLGLFILFKAGPYAIGNPFWFSLFQDSIGGTASAIFYCISIAFIYSYAKQFFDLIGNVGKMALSNYLFQSIISVFCFYSIGLGWYGELSMEQTLVFVLVVYILQVILSTLWLKRFERGPVEWIWRRLIYGKPIPFIRKDKLAS